MNTHCFRKISVVTYNSKRFQVFKDEKNRYAFLEIDKDNKLRYPKIEDFIGLANIFSKDLDNEVYFRNNKNNENKYVFKTFVCASGAILALSSALYIGLQNQKVFTSDNVPEVISISDNYEAEELKQDINEDNATVEITINNEEATVNISTPVVEDNTYVESKVVTDDMYGIYGNQIDIYDSTALNKFLGEKNITLNDINEVVDNNTNLNDDLKIIIKDFAQKFKETYPSIDMRLFYENVKKINVIYETEESIKEHGDRAAWFNYDLGEIHVNENIDLSKGSNDLMVLRHEICHMVSLGVIYQDDKKIMAITNNGGYGEYLLEAIDVILSTEPFKDEYEFDDFGYEASANELNAIIKAIPDFDYSVLANQDVYNIAAYLDSVIPNDINASRFIDLLDMQTIAYYNMSSIRMESSEFKDLYRYIANTYINYVITPDMSYDEIIEVKTNLINQLNKNLKYPYGITYYDEIDNVFNEYIEINGIEQNYKTK